MFVRFQLAQRNDLNGGQGELAVGALDFGLVSRAGDAEDLVIVSFAVGSQKFTPLSFVSRRRLVACESRLGSSSLVIPSEARDL